ncbi:MAG: Aryl-alcohol dehydrogenase [Chlamydiales bacterium]|nr:Aryl-alcohol dehydrogenase [Chlamydiales bacterium]MCH9635055.1 Aryl-alcohol dehydrogenase [Chlamydiales bacterium]MCH9703654.1 zinc-binding dehydrogenase [Chlamydiota bacterium]
MLGAVLKQTKQPLELMQLQTAILKEGQVLVQIAYSGLCHTQLNEIFGRKGEDKFLPHTLGHEGSGIVLEVGPSVSKVKKGDHVVLTWLKGAGHDVPSTQYSSEDGAINSGAISTFMECAVVSENRLVPIPKEMPLKEAALLGCALPTGAGVVKNEMQLEEGSSFALFGCGGVGLSGLLCAVSRGANPVIAVDICEKKLQRAKELGATHLVDARKDPASQIHEICGGVDYAFESAGRKEAMEAAYRSLRSPGLCVLAGNLPKGQTISIDPFDLICGKQIRGTWGGKSQVDEDVAYYADLFLKGELKLTELITHEVPLREINTLVDQLERGEVGRGIIACAAS